MESECEAVYYASGCKNVTEFISSPVFCHSVQYAYLGDDVSWGYHPIPEGELPVVGNITFSLKNLRAREEAGSLPCFLHALPTSVPSCKHLGLWGVQLASFDELTSLCRGIASPLCTLQSLDLDVRLTFADTTPAEMKRLLGDALSVNSSIRTLTIISKLCPQDHWISSSVNYLHVKLEGNDTLDVLYSVFAGLADNSICLSTISISGPYGSSNEIDTSGFMGSTMLESEKLLGICVLTNTSLTGMHLYDLVMPREAFHLLFTSLNRNPNMTSFSLIGYPFLPGDVVCMLFAALEKNPHLTSLDLSHNCGEDWPSASSVLNSLRINGFLTDLTFDESPLEEEMSEEENIEGVTWEVLSAQLECNRKNVEQMKASESLVSTSVLS